MLKRVKTIQSNLFITYAIIILTVLIIFMLFFYLWGSRMLKEKAFDTIANLASSSSEKFDIEVKKMDSVSMNILYSNIVKDKFENYIYEKEKDKESGFNQEKSNYNKNTKDLIEVLFAIIGPYRPVQQIYLYDFKGNVFGTGSDNRQQHVSVKEKPWYNDVIKNSGKKYLTLPMKDDELSKFITRSKGLYFISLCRIYFDSYDRPQGIVEVKQYCDEIFKSIEFNKRNNTNGRIYVYNSTGSLIYPFKENTGAEDSFYFKQCSSVPPGKTSITVNNPFSMERELLDYKYSNFTGWTTVVVISEKKLLSPVFAFTKIVILVTAVILLFALGFSFIAAKKITVPVAKLRKAIRSLSLESIDVFASHEISSDLNELEDLNRAFQKMNTKLKESHDSLMLSQQHEMQAKMLALQSQMNPHFLYNTLTTISVMAEEDMNKQIIEMCKNVSGMLRYISSDKSPLVKLSTEIEYTEKFLACMKFRYGDKMSYNIEIEDGMRDIRIPKLVVQPLVENALKYGTNKRPPWNIRIYGYKTSTYWQICVQDNGPGFDEDKLNSINDKIKEIDKSGLLPSLELEGMGLLNIYIRLKFSYKNQMTFGIANYITGGSIITIGGSL